MWKDLLEIVREEPCTPKEAREVLDYLERGTKARFYADENFPSAAINCFDRWALRLGQLQMRICSDIRTGRMLRMH